MKKLLLLAGIAVWDIAPAQYEGRIGVNTDTPRATIEIKAKFTENVQGILFPHISETEKNAWKKDDTEGVVAGTIIWNTTKTCLDIFDGTNWKCTDGTKVNTHGINWVDDEIENIEVLTERWFNAPWMKLKGVINATQNGFLVYDGTDTLPQQSEIKLFNWYEAKQAYGQPVKIDDGEYSLPTPDEWGVVLSNYNVEYTSTKQLNNMIENRLLGSDLRYDLRNTGSTITYAHRFKNDNELKSAWRYEYIPNKGLKINLVHLESIKQGNATINEISTEEFWDKVHKAPTNNAKKEIFIPAYGGSGSVYGQSGIYWTDTFEANSNSYAKVATFNSTKAYNHTAFGTRTYPLFLIRRK